MAQNLFGPGSAVGNQLSGLVNTLFDPSAGAQAEARAAKIERDRMETQLRQAQIDKYKMEREEKAAQSKQEAEMISRMVSGFMGGDPQGAAVMDYRKAGGVAPNTLPALDDMGESVNQPPTIPMDRPAGYTPEREVDLNRIIMALEAERGLGGKSFKSAAEGAESVQQQGYRTALGGDPALGPLDPVKVTQAFYATKGGTPYSQQDGRVLSNVTGALNEGGQQAQANVLKTGSETKENNAQAARAGRDDAPLVQVPDPSSPTGFKWSTRGAAVGQGAPIAGAAKASDAFFEPTKPNVTAFQKEDKEAEDTRALITEARNLASDPRNFGTSGLLRSTVQDAIAQGDALARTLGARAAAVQQDVMSLGSEVGLENFDTKLPQLDLMTNLLAFRLAKMNDPGGRVTDQDFRIAKSKLSGGTFLGNQQDFLARLNLFENTLSGQQGRTRTLLGGRGRAGPITPAAPTAPAAGQPSVSNW